MNRWASFACPSGTESIARRLIAGKIVRPSHSPRPGGTREIGCAIHCGNPATSVCVVPEGRTMLAQRFIAGCPRCLLIPGRPGGTRDDGQGIREGSPTQHDDHDPRQLSRVAPKCEQSRDSGERRPSFARRSGLREGGDAEENPEKRTCPASCPRSPPLPTPEDERGRRQQGQRTRLRRHRHETRLESQVGKARRSECEAFVQVARRGADPQGRLADRVR